MAHALYGHFTLPGHLCFPLGISSSSAELHTACPSEGQVSFCEFKNSHFFFFFLVSVHQSIICLYSCSESHSFPFFWLVNSCLCFLPTISIRYLLVLRYYISFVFSRNVSYLQIFEGWSYDREIQIIKDSSRGRSKELVTRNNDEIDVGLFNKKTFRQSSLEVE